jgi:hypothetical protein
MGIFLLMFLLFSLQFEKRISAVILCGKGFCRVDKRLGFIGNVFYH